MILTEDRNYTISLELEDCENQTGLSSETVELEFTNKELLHAVITCGMPLQRLTPAWFSKRKSELLYKIFLVLIILMLGTDYQNWLYIGKH